MKRTKVKEGCFCPKCGNIENQKRNGLNRSKTQKMFCNDCGTNYTLKPKTRAYPEEIRAIAIKEYYAGLSGMMVGKIHGFNKANVLNWIKKTK